MVPRLSQSYTEVFNCPYLPILSLNYQIPDILSLTLIRSYNKKKNHIPKKVLSFLLKSTIVSLKTEVRFTKNGGTIYRKRRYVLSKTEVRFIKKQGTFY